MTKVINIYGGTTWLQHSGYFLRGATSGVTANSATKTGGSDDAIVVSHSHTTNLYYNNWYQPSTGSGMGHVLLLNYQAGSAAVTPSTSTKGSSGTNANIPNYKSVYIWERVS